MLNGKRDLIWIDTTVKTQVSVNREAFVLRRGTPFCVKQPCMRDKAWQAEHKVDSHPCPTFGPDVP